MVVCTNHAQHPGRILKQNHLALLWAGGPTGWVLDPLSPCGNDWGDTQKHACEHSFSLFHDQPSSFRLIAEQRDNALGISTATRLTLGLEL